MSAKIAFSRNLCLCTLLYGLLASPILGQSGSSPLPPGTMPVTQYSPAAWVQRNPCTHPAQVTPRTRFEIPGLFGRPYRDQLPGGCVCGQPSGITRSPDASVYWSAPMSSLAQQRNPAFHCWWETTGRQQAFAPIDSLGQFSGVAFRRTDNGYCGPSADPYGCVSASRQK